MTLYVCGSFYTHNTKSSVRGLPCAALSKDFGGGTKTGTII
jgi:hypothetical protein